MTLETLAEKTGMTKSYLSKVERGLSTPSIATALKLSKALSVPVEELFAEEGAASEGYSLVRHDERQPLARDDEGPAYASLARQIGDRALLPFIVHPPGTSAIRPSRSTWARSSSSSTAGGWRSTSCPSA